MKKIYLSLALLLMLCNLAWSQNVGVNTNGAAPDASAMLDVSSADKGLLVPRVSLTASNVAAPVTAPATSLLVYNTATAGTAPNDVVPGYYYWAGTAWVPFMVGGTSQATNERMRIDGTGAVGIATITPNASTNRDVNGAIKLGPAGTVLKNVVTAEITGAAVAVPAAVMTTVPAAFTPGSVDVSYTIPAISSVRGTARVSFDTDLPAGVSVAWSRIVSTTQVRVRFLNNGTTARSIPAGIKIYLSVTEF